MYIVLLFPFLFLLHEIEEVVVQRRWMALHQARLLQRFPRLRRLIEHLGSLSTKAFAVAASEELLLLLLVTCYVLVDGPGCFYVWAAVFIAFAVHLHVHVVQAVAVVGYVPGLLTTLLLLPTCYLGIQTIWLRTSGWEILGLGIAGTVFIALNLRFAHWLGKRVA